MKTVEAIKKRRSIRSYSSKQIPKETLVELLELANLAPSAVNQQNRHFIVIQNKETKQKLYEISRKQTHILEAPTIIVVAINTKQFEAKDFLEGCLKWGTDLWGANLKNYSGNKKFQENFNRWSMLWPIQDASAAITTFMLASVDKGIDTCWIGLTDTQEIKEFLNLQKNFEVIALITLGYRKSEPSSQSRKPIKKFLHWEKW